MSELDTTHPLFAEIMSERASAYFTTVRRLEGALEALRQFDREGEPASLVDRTDSTRGQLRGELLAEAAEQCWIFMIQREAMRLPYYAEIFSDFGIPDEVRRRMGPKTVPG